LKAQIADPNTKSSIKSRARKKLRMLEQAQAAGMTRENVMKSGGSMSAKFRQGEMVSASPPVAGAAAGGGGGNVSISAPTSTSNQSTSTYPITSRPNNLALDRIRSSLDF
jgi:hypothetical protein